jgi:hypothetical protein
MIAIDAKTGERHRLSIRNAGNRFTVSRYAPLEPNQKTGLHFVIEDAVSRDKIVADYEDAERLDAVFEQPEALAAFLAHVFDEDENVEILMPNKSDGITH